MQHASNVMSRVARTKPCVPTFDDAALREIVNTVSNGRDCLLEIVNFNVEDQPSVS
ncbi:hypothetical protein BGY98DRAFT_1041823 [Russula aff. rugulosa BPL654]|nr:hypothetical protein BGY98DRAFT_1041823 [Russula aff. rugulosa BPL654]